MERKNEVASVPHLKLYRELAEWYPLLTPVEDYEEETGFYRSLFTFYCRRTPRTLLDLGSGAGHNAAYLKGSFSCTLVDQEPAMVKLNRRMNPECRHVQGDMRSIRLRQVFDCVLLHDAVNYMRSRTDLVNALTTAFVHTAHGGAALFQPDFVAETFESGTETGGSEKDGRAVRYLEWRWVPDPGAEMYVADMAYMLRDRDGSVEVAQDRHWMGLFPRSVWLELIGAAGFEPLAVPFAPGRDSGPERELFLGLRPGPPGGM
ncbi:class I SAM-dependent methyltransferase [Aminivibrio sp.]|uniref:class I SAM-dependent methyltransferase n=1 Tax=Aminivibrio sp. TaxID=1872489 RepID=UPI003D9982DB